MSHPTTNKTKPQKLFWHLKVLAGALFISIVFAFLLNQKIAPAQMIMSIVLTFMQLELFIWLGYWFFEPVKVDQPNFKRQIITRLFMFYALVMLLAIVLFIVVYAIQYSIHYDDFGRFFSSLINLEMKGFFIATLVGFGIGAVFFFYVLWAEAVDRAQKLREEKLIFQYETLKSQVNPHFLFNSLNSLSSLIRKDPDLSEQFIQKLSSVYRYILDNREKELVPLATELEFVNNYFYLQKIRDEDKIILKNELKTTEKLEVLPVSLQLLVENALKHNAATRKQPLEITIHSEGLDKLVVRNNLQKKTQFNNSSKIGLKNLNERCRLILKREIEIQETEDEFVVKIPVKLN
jgi:signal transduction histidine kinase